MNNLKVEVVECAMDVINLLMQLLEMSNTILIVLVLFLSHIIQLSFHHTIVTSGVVA